jgi:very-short-patch-repair endonuclease
VVIESLTRCGSWYSVEYPVGPYVFDFAIPGLRLLLELDSSSYHRLPRQFKRDRIKVGFAKEKGWTVARFWPGPDLAIQVEREVTRRRAELGH